MGEAEDRLSALRSVAHPVRLRILSMLTAEAMSAAEVARTLDLSHANASYHLRVLHDAGELVVESEERIRGGVAKRYRYVADAEPSRPPREHSNDDYIAYARASHTEVVRRLTHKVEGRMSDSDLETWVTPETWERAVAMMHEATMLLHESALPPHTDGAVHVSATTLAFEMADE